MPSLEHSTSRMLLRPLRRGDRDEFIRVHELSRELFAPWSPLLPAATGFDSLFEHTIDKALQGARDQTEYRLAGQLPDGRIAGFFNLFHIVRGAFQSAVVSWSVSADVGRQGFGTEGVAGLLHIAFSRHPAGLHLHRVQANIIPANTASVRVAEKNGFRCEGLAKKYLMIAGHWQDHLLFAKLAEEHHAG